MATNNIITTELVVKTDASKKSLAELEKSLRAAKNAYKNLSADDKAGASVLRQNIQALAEATNEATQEMNDLFKATKKGAEGMDKMADEAKQLEGAVKKAFNRENLKEFTKSLGTMFATFSKGGGTAADAVDGLGDSLSALGPQAALVGQIGKFAFGEINKGINASIGGAEKLQASFNATIKAGSQGVFAALRLAAAPFTFLPKLLLTGKNEFKDAFQSLAGVGETYRKEELRTQSEFLAKRQAAELRAGQALLDANVAEFDQLATDTNKSFEIISKALIDRREAEFAASKNRAAVASKEREAFLQDADVAAKVAANGANFTKALTAEQLETYLGYQSAIDAEARLQVAKKREYEKDYTDFLRVELQFQLANYVSATNGIIEKDEFVLENRRLGFADTFKLQEEVFKTKQAQLQKELAIQAQLNAEYAKSGSVDKEGVARANEIQNELNANFREYQQQRADTVREFTQREIDLEAAKNEVLLQGMETIAEFGAETLAEQNALIETIGALQIKTLQKTLANLNQEDKDYLIQKQDIENQIVAMELDTKKRSFENFMRYLTLQLQAEVDRLDTMQEMRQNEVDYEITSAKKLNAGLQNVIGDLEEKFSQIVFGAIKVGKELREFYAVDTAQRIQELNNVANAELENTKQAIDLAQKKRAALQLEMSEAQAAGRLTKEREQEINRETAAIENQIATLENKEVDIKIQLEVDTKNAERELSQKTKDLNKAMVEKFAEGTQEVAGLFLQMSEAISQVIDAIATKQAAAVDKQILNSQRAVAENDKLIGKLGEREEKATGARQRRLQKEIKAVEAKNKREAELQEKLEQEKIKIEREANKKKQILAIANVIINTASAVAGVTASTSIDPTGILRAVQIALVVALGAAQVAAISAQKFARGGIVNGKSHAQGGEKFQVGNRVVELEGNEAVINKTSMAIPGVARAASFLNQLGGGVAFANGGVVPTFGGGNILPTPQTQGSNAMLDALQGILVATQTRQVVLPIPTLNDVQNQVAIARSNSTL